MDMNKIFSQITEAAVSGVEGIDGIREWEKKQWKIDIGSFDISIFRGKNIEKASIGRIKLKVDKIKAGSGKKIISSLNIKSCQLNIYPSNPCLPAGLFNIENRISGNSSDRVGGYMSIFPMNDETGITDSIKKTFYGKIKQYGYNPADILKDYGSLWQELDWEFKGEKGIGMKISAEGVESKYVNDIFMSLLKGYIACLSKFKDCESGRADEEKMFLFRHALTEFIVLKDPSSKFIFGKGLPLETISSMILPPVVRF